MIIDRKFLTLPEVAFRIKEISWASLAKQSIFDFLPRKKTLLNKFFTENKEEFNTCPSANSQSLSPINKKKFNNTDNENKVHFDKLLTVSNKENKEYRYKQIQNKIHKFNRKIQFGEVINKQNLEKERSLPSFHNFAPNTSLLEELIYKQNMDYFSILDDSYENYDISPKNRKNKDTQTAKNLTARSIFRKNSFKANLEGLDLRHKMRRKSCYCKDCGGISKLEIKTLDLMPHFSKFRSEGKGLSRDFDVKKIESRTNLEINMSNKNSALKTKNTPRSLQKYRTNLALEIENTPSMGNISENTLQSLEREFFNESDTEKKMQYS